MSKDSYQVFLDAFNIQKDDLYHWGIESTIFPELDKPFRGKRGGCK